MNQNTPDWRSLQHPQTSQLNLTHFTWVRLATLASTDPPSYFPVLHPGLKRRFSQKKRYTIYVRLGKNTSEKIGIFKIKLRLSKSSRLLQRIAFLVIVFVSYSRQKLIKFDTSLIWCNVCHSISARLLTKAQTIVSISQQKMC